MALPSPRRLDSVTIRGFQSIRRLDDFTLGDLNVLIGPNGAGKSNFVSYFHMLNALVEQRLGHWVNQRGGADRLMTYGVKETKVIFSRVQFGDNGYGFELSPTPDGSFLFDNEVLYYQGRYPDGYTIGSGHSESNLKDEVSTSSAWRMADYCFSSISSWKNYHFHDTSSRAGVNRYGPVVDSKYLRSNAENLAAYLFRIRRTHPESYGQIVSLVRLAIPFFDDFELYPDERPDENQVIRLLWRQKGSDYPLWPTQLSDGSIRFICLATALLQPNPPSTLIIDEPELGLHPYAITLLGALMRSASKRMQLIISTQSVPLLNEFAIDDLVVVEREEGVSVFKRLESETFAEWLKEYSVGELWEKNILGGRP